MHVPQPLTTAVDPWGDSTAALCLTAPASHRDAVWVRVCLRCLRVDIGNLREQIATANDLQWAVEVASLVEENSSPHVNAGVNGVRPWVGQLATERRRHRPRHLRHDWAWNHVRLNPIPRW